MFDYVWLDNSNNIIESIVTWLGSNQMLRQYIIGQSWLNWPKRRYWSSSFYSNLFNGLMKFVKPSSSGCNILAFQFRPSSDQEILASSRPCSDQPVRPEPHRNPSNFKSSTMDSHLPEELQQQHLRLHFSELWKRWRLESDLWSPYVEFSSRRRRWQRRWSVWIKLSSRSNIKASPFVLRKVTLCSCSQGWNKLRLKSYFSPFSPRHIAFL